MSRLDTVDPAFEETFTGETRSPRRGCLAPPQHTVAVFCAPWSQCRRTAGGQVPRGWAWCREKAGAGRGAFTPERPGGSDRREDCRGSRLLFTKSEACHKKENKLRVAVEARPRRPFLRRRRLQPQGSVSGERTCQEQGSLTVARGCRAAPRLPGPLGFQKKTGSSRPRPERPPRRPDPWGCTAAPGVYERSGTGPSCDF